MDVLKKLLLISSFLFLSGCQLDYLLKSAYNQVALLNQRVPVSEALENKNLTEDEKRKLKLAQKAKAFSEETLFLKKTKNYTSFVKLDRPYVTYVVSASPKWELKHHQWSYPIVGDMPYKGFFNEADSFKEVEKLAAMDLDTYQRGVSAYSTLGWFQDPILSSMLRYKDYDLVNTIIHETVHATLYIKNSADFNERMAVFLGNKGTEMFYSQEEGPQSPTLQKIKNENEDDRLFSEFISGEIKALEDWYKQQTDHNEDLRAQRLKEIQKHFSESVAKKLKTDTYAKFPTLELNNARLLIYKTYMQDLSDFEKLYANVGQNFKLFLDQCRNLEKSQKPEEELRQLNSQTGAK